jgi:phenylalanyl-tRNA synthetase beta chain
MKFRIKDLQNYLRGKIDWKKVSHDLTLKSFETNFSDDILDVDILPNRYPDASSLIGLAKEISRVSGLNFFENKIRLKESYKKIDKNLVKIQTSHCFYYFGKIILNVNNKPSPEWLKEFVEFYGFNSVNFLVDLSNFVMIEYGAPLHIFDLDKINLPIYVRLAKKGEKFVSLEDKEYQFLGEEIVITDKKKILGLAGIKGGKNSAVDLQTKNIFIEAAVFDPSKIYSTSRKLNLKTEASFRFERKVAPIRSLQALLRLSYLIQKNLGGEILKGIIGEKKIKDKVINFNIERLNKFTGINFKKNEVRKIFQKLDIKVISENKNIFKLILPLDRLDLESEEDIIEEVIRIYDLNKIPTVYEIPFKEVNIDPEIEFNNYLRKILTKAGYDEVHNYSFFGDKDLKYADYTDFTQTMQKNIYAKSAFDSAKSTIEVLNPISEHYKYFQTSLIPNLLKSVHFNQFFFKEIRIFEISKIAYWEKEKINENFYLGIGFAFKDYMEILKELKGVLKVLENELKINFNLKEINQNQAEIFVNNEKIGIFGLIPEKVLEDYNLDLKVGVIEINIENLRKYQKLIKKFESWPIFPSIARDLSFFVDEKIKFSEIEKEIEKQKFNFLKEIKLIDVYFTDKKSMTIRFIFNHPERSLKDEEVNIEIEKIEKFLKDKFKINLR